MAKKSNNEAMVALDKKRTNCLFLCGELRELAFWLEQGMKESEARDLVIQLIRKEADLLQKEAEKLYQKIFPK